MKAHHSTKPRRVSNKICVSHPSPHRPTALASPGSPLHVLISTRDDQDLSHVC